MVFLTFSFSFASSLFRPGNFYQKDAINYSSRRYGYVNPIKAEPLYDGEKNRFNFRFYINDPTFDPFDNPYGKIIYHHYTNMKDINDT